MLCFLVLIYATTVSAGLRRNATLTSPKNMYNMLKEMEELPSVAEYARDKRQAFDNPYHPEDALRGDRFNEDRTGQLDRIRQQSMRDVRNEDLGKSKTFKKSRSSRLYTAA